MSESEYRPGVCNIGRDERRKRRLAGVVGFGVAGVYVAAVVATGGPDALLLYAFPALFGGFVGVVQDRLGFCVAFGALARYDLSGSGGGDGRVEDADAVWRDRRRALVVVVYAAAAAALATAAVYGVGTAI